VEVPVKTMMTRSISLCRPSSACEARGRILVGDLLKSMNPNAKPFSFNTGASSWTPGGGFTPSTAPASAPAPAPVAAAEPEPEKAKEIVYDEGEDDEDEIDESDPLWQAVIKITEGDRKKASKMLENPDELMSYPEIKKILESGGDDEEPEPEPEKATETPPVPAPASASSEKASSATPPPAPTSGKKAAADADEEEQDVDEQVVEEEDPRNHLNLVFIGHVDAGKSTLSGSILYVTGNVDKRTIERYEREAKDRNRESWFLAFIMDTSEEERAKGKTVEVGRATFETDIHRYTILDAPGHKNYVPNMISGAAQADVGILVISARRGEFETGFEKGGQTREHALLAKTLGVQYLVVVINKMDDPTVCWAKERYDECVSKLKPYLKQCGYAIKKDVKFLPISGLSGDNILNEVKPETCPWWKELYSTGENGTTTPTLMKTLDTLSIDGRNAEAPLRVPVLDRYYERGCVVLGKVEQGTLRTGDEIVLAPTKKTTRVDGIYIGEKYVATAKPGENVLIKLSITIEDVQKGYVISSAISPCPAVTEIKVQLALVEMLEHRPLFTPGYDAMMHVHTAEIEVTCRSLVSVLDKGKEVVRPFARQGQVCTAILSMPLSTCMESYKDMNALGRVTLRDEGRTIAIGKILGMKRVPA